MLARDGTLSGSTIPPNFSISVYTFLSPTHSCGFTTPLRAVLPTPMRTASPSEIAAARIPKITELRDQLCYGDAKLSRCSAFSDDLRVFRRRYSLGPFRGADLWDWKSSEHQAALKLMTASFLDHHGYGEVYWPSDPASPNYNSLQYSKDNIL